MGEGDIWSGNEKGFVAMDRLGLSSLEPKSHVLH